jgi:hypothetical protein
MAGTRGGGKERRTGGADAGPARLAGPGEKRTGAVRPRACTWAKRAKRGKRGVVGPCDDFRFSFF